MNNCNHDEHFVGEIGTVFYVNCGVDVSSATDISILLSRPDGTIIDKSAAFAVFQGSNNYVKFSISSGDFNQEGEYLGQVELTLGPWTGKGREFTINVDEGLSSSSSSAS